MLHQKNLHSSKKKSNFATQNPRGGVKVINYCPGGGMVDALVSGASAARRAGSSPVLGTVKSRNSLKIKSCGISLLIFVLLLSSYFNSTEFSSSAQP